jgi:hypothetical protein
MTSSVERVAIGHADNGHEYDGCKLYLNGAGPRARHCPECDLRLYLIGRERASNHYRVRDHDGRLIRSDWLL